MREVKIHFTRNRHGKVFSKAIMWYEDVEFSHCALEFKLNKIDEDVIYHSSMTSGVNFCSKDIFLEDNEIMYTFTLYLTDEAYYAMLKDLIHNCGTKYALMQNLGIVLVDLAHKLGKDMKNPWKDGYNCSELVYYHVIRNLIKDAEVFERNLVKPSHIKKILENHLGE